MKPVDVKPVDTHFSSRSPQPARALLAAALALGLAIAAPLQAQEVADGGASAGSSAPAMDPAPADPSLRPVLDDFGGREGLAALMDDFMAGLLADRRTRPFFENVDQPAVKQHLADQFCVILGGDCRYTGRDMRAAHAQMGVTRADFNALVEVLQVAMDKRGIPFRSQNKLLAKLAPMYRDIESR
jgi:hemoglobin